MNLAVCQRCGWFVNLDEIPEFYTEGAQMCDECRKDARGVIGGSCEGHPLPQPGEIDA